MKSTKTKFNEDLAEFYGAMLGDGCLSRYFSNCANRIICCVLLTGNSREISYYEYVIRPIIFNEFRLKGCIRLRKKDNVVRFETSSKRVFDFMESEGFPVGKKKNIKIPNSIFEDEKLSLSCVRGIFDTDGCVYSRYSKKYESHFRQYDYKNVQFKMNSQTVIKQVNEILNRNDIRTSNITKDRNSYVLRIYHQDSVRYFFDLINPRNKHHIERFLNST